MSCILSLSLTVDIVEYKEMSFVCFCVPCAVIVVIEEALIRIWLAASYMHCYALGLKFERHEFVERHIARYVDSDYVGDLDKLHSTLQLGADHQ